MPFLCRLLRCLRICQRICMHLICALLHCLWQQCEERETVVSICKDAVQIKIKKEEEADIMLSPKRAWIHYLRTYRVYSEDQNWLQLKHVILARATLMPKSMETNQVNPSTYWAPVTMNASLTGNCLSGRTLVVSCAWPAQFSPSQLHQLPPFVALLAMTK